MKIVIRPVFGETFTLEVESCDFVENVKEKIRYRLGTWPYRQGLIFRQQLMEDGRTLRDYNVQNDDTIDFATPMRGGN